MSVPLHLDPEVRFTCAQCGECCRGWTVAVSAAERETLLGRDPAFAESMEPGPLKLWVLKKRPDGGCVHLQADGLCAIHARFGETAKPLMCQRFPYLEVASDEAVWATANFACKAVREDHGPALSASVPTLERLFATKLAQVPPQDAVWYPARPDVQVSAAEWDAALVPLFEQWTDVPAALRSLAGFVRTAPEVGPLATPAAIAPSAQPGPVRYAFALTLYADLFDTTSFWSRLQGVVALPRAMRFAHRYRSRLLDVDVDMAAVVADARPLDPDADALIRRWLRSRLRSRQIFRGVPTAAAGMTRLILHANLVIYLVKVLGEPTLDHARTALRAVEAGVSQQLLERALQRIDPRLVGFWQDPAVAAGAADLFRPQRPQA